MNKRFPSQTFTERAICASCSSEYKRNVTVNFQPFLIFRDMIRGEHKARFEPLIRLCGKVYTIVGRVYYTNAEADRSVTAANHFFGSVKIGRTFEAFDSMRPARFNELGTNPKVISGFKRLTLLVFYEQVREQKVKLTVFTAFCEGNRR